jgi:sugar lactone lactonase YvrE
MRRFVSARLRSRFRILASVAFLFVFLGSSVESCLFLDRLTALYTGTYAEYNYCSLEVQDCFILEETEDVVDCAICTSGLGSDGRGIAARGGIEADLFWSELQRRIVHLPSGQAEPAGVLDFARWPMSVALDTENEYVYTSDWRQQSIRRISFDGMSSENLIVGTSGFTGVTLDLAAGKMYWGDIAAGAIRRADLDGSNVEVFRSGVPGPTDLALDTTNGRLCWTHNNATEGSETHSIQCAALDASDGVEEVVSGLSSPFGLAITADAFYWTDMLDGAIRRADLDGSNVSDVLTGLEDPGALAVDPVNDQIFWSGFSTITINRAALDGSGVTTLLPGSPASDLAVDPTAGTVYWTGWIAGDVRRAGINGGNFATLDRGEIIDGAVAVDPAGEKMYWTLAFRGAVQRSNLDGSDVEDVATGQFGLGDIAVDTLAQQLYWTSDGAIVRADLDGSSPETVTENILFLSDIELYPELERVYWINQDEIGTALLDGSGEGVLLMEDDGPERLAIDPANQRIYWSVPVAGVIRRFNLDGTGTVEDVVTDIPFVREVDIRGDHIYWTLPDGRIQRSDLDGSGIEDVVTGRPAISGLEVTGGLPSVATELPAVADGAFTLAAAHPNPFAAEANISLSVREAQHVTVTVYDLLGRRLAQLHDGVLVADRTHHFTLDGRGWASGVYIYEVAGEHFRTSRTVTLVR